MKLEKSREEDFELIFTNLRQRNFISLPTNLRKEEQFKATMIKREMKNNVY